MMKAIYSFYINKLLNQTRTETLDSWTILRQFSDNDLDINSKGLKGESLNSFI